MRFGVEKIVLKEDLEKQEKVSAGSEQETNISLVALSDLSRKILDRLP